ncbi:MAG: tetratricopeptide repeat protein, partial [Chitinophagales bacterium]|nr:tetratricopeptide repeat protein [Chitinophagales bacterium]
MSKRFRILGIILCGLIFSPSHGQEWDRFNSKGLEYYKKKNFKKASNYLIKAREIASREFGIQHINYAIACYNLASVYEELQQPDKAIPLYAEYFSLKKLLDEANKDLAIELAKTANYCADNNFQETAVKFWSEARDIFKGLSGESEEFYAVMCVNLGYGFKKLEQYDSAISNFSNALPIYVKLKGDCSDDHVEILAQLQKIYFNTFSKYNEALISISKEYCDCLVKRHGPASLQYIQALNDLSYAELASGNYYPALQYLSEGINLINRHWPSEKILLAEMLANKANTLFKLGQFAEGEQDISKALQLYEPEKDKYPEMFTSTLIRWAVFKNATGNLQEAEKALLTAQHFAKQHLNNSDYELIIMRNLASVYLGMGYPAKAEQLYLKQFNLLKDDKQGRDYYYYMSNYDLAMFYYETGSYENALEYAHQSLRLCEGLFGKQSDQCVADNLLLSGIYMRLEKFSEAKSILLSIAPLILTAKGEISEEYALLLSNLSTIYKNELDRERAVELMTKSVNIYERYFGRRHAKYAEALLKLADTYAFAGNYTGTSQVTTEAFSILKESLGENHPIYAKACYSMGALYQETGNYSKGEQYLLLAKQIQEHVQGKSHHDYCITLNALGSLYIDLGDYIKGETFLTEAVNGLEKGLGKNHQLYSAVYHNLGVLYYKLGQLDRAEKIFREIIHIEESKTGSNILGYAYASAQLASLLINKMQYDEAEKLLMNAFDIILKYSGPNSIEYADVCQKMAFYFNKRGRFG